MLYYARIDLSEGIYDDIFYPQLFSEEGLLET